MATTKRKLRLPAKKEEAKVSQKEATPKARNKDQGMISHRIEFSDHGGTSGLTVSRKSATRIDVTRFNTTPDAKVTPRDEAFLAGIKAQYGRKEFARGDLDAGALRRAIERGFIEPVSSKDTNIYAHTFRLLK